MAGVTFRDVEKIYPGNVKAVEDFNLDVKDKELVVLVGPSGCGKSTTLRMAAGLEEITRGTVTIGGRVVNDIPPKDRDIAMVFQNYALYPHMTVRENMAFGLKLRGLPKAVIHEHVMEAADILGIGELLDRRPKALSGGQRQRVAVGRAIVRKPEAFLFDEPLSNLDAKMRVQMRVEISRLHKRLESTMIYVTHDQMEAMTLGDRIVVMNMGLIQQIADPITLYDKPANQFVAGFIGIPPMNFVKGTIESEGVGLRFNANGFTVPMPAEWRERVAPHVGQRVTFGIRPEDMGSNGGEQLASIPRIQAIVDVVEPMGSESYLYLRTGAHALISRVDPHRKVRVGEIVNIHLFMRNGHLFDADGQAIV